MLPGAILPWPTLAATCAVVPAALILFTRYHDRVSDSICPEDRRLEEDSSPNYYICSFIYNSPIWYLRGSDEKTAEKALKQFRSNNHNIQKELSELKLQLGKRFVSNQKVALIVSIETQLQGQCRSLNCAQPAAQTHSSANLSSPSMFCSC